MERMDGWMEIRGGGWDGGWGMGDVRCKKGARGKGCGM